MNPMIARYAKSVSIAIVTILLMISTDSYASLRHYVVDVEQSDWKLSEQTRLKCELKHEIDGYGTALFYSEASKQLNMEFTLDMWRLPSRYDSARVYSMAPRWMSGVANREIANMDLRKQYDGDLPSESAWQMLTELEKGFLPTIEYSDWLNPNDGVAVSLNASKFGDSYHQFSRCITNLLPYSLEDIAYTVLAYKKNSTELTPYSKRRLDMIGEYLKEDLDLDLVLIDGYTDSWGGSYNNEKLSIKRANEVKDYFAGLGLLEDRIQITGHGEKRHSSPNDTRLDRAKNRRVVVRLSKES
ncbi:flagellar protein MotY [Ningiella sp. W23]|uniref:flagellar protein MotY n=1 Tax=Ningiella sp. W23 TaxID=3023715 RepID=UPI0037566A39